MVQEVILNAFTLYGIKSSCVFHKHAYERVGKMLKIQPLIAQWRQNIMYAISFNAGTKESMITKMARKTRSLGRGL